MSKRKGTKGTLAMLQTAGLSMVVLVVVIAVGAQILGQINDTQTANTTEANITNAGLEALGTFGDWFSIVIIIVVAVVIISLLVMAFRSRED